MEEELYECGNRCRRHLLHGILPASLWDAHGQAAELFPVCFFPYVGFSGFIELCGMRIEDDSRGGGGNCEDIAFSPATARSVRGPGTDHDRHVIRHGTGSTAW